MKLLALAFFAFSLSNVAYAKLITSNPHQIVYEAGGFIISKQCPNNIPDATTDCGVLDADNNRLPPAIALPERTFKETSLASRLDSKAALNPGEAQRFLGPQGPKLIAHDIYLLEKELQNIALEDDTRNPIRAEINRLRVIDGAVKEELELLTDIKSPGFVRTTPFNKNMRAVERAFKDSSTEIYIADHDNRVWWFLLGRGDFYDAMGITRQIVTLNGYNPEYGVHDAPDQSNLGGCRHRNREARLPSYSQLEDLGRRPVLSDAILKRLGVDFKEAISESNMTINFRNRYPNESFFASFLANKVQYKAEKRPILCIW